MSLDKKLADLMNGEKQTVQRKKEGEISMGRKLKNNFYSNDHYFWKDRKTGKWKRKLKPAHLRRVNKFRHSNK